MKKLLSLASSISVLLAATCPASVIVSGDFAAGTGQITITEDLSFTLTASGVPRRIILDEYLVYDGATQGPSSVSGITYAINGVDQGNMINFQLFDGGVNVNDITLNDFHLSFFGPTPPTLNMGDVFTIRSITVSGFSAAPGFNPTTGLASNVFLTASDGTRLSATQNFVPEPSSLALFGLGAVALLTRRKRVER